MRERKPPPKATMDEPLRALWRPEHALETVEPPPDQQRKDGSAFSRLRRKIEREGLSDVIFFGILDVTLVPLFFVLSHLLKWPLRGLWFVLCKINAPVKRLSASHRIAQRMCTFFERHGVVTRIVQASIVLVWFVPVFAFAIHRWHTLFPGADIARDVRGAWLLVVLGAGALAVGAMGNGPAAEMVVAPEPEVDLGFVCFVVGMLFGPPIVLALWAYGVL
jgi:hypothetical protein